MSTAGQDEGARPIQPVPPPPDIEIIKLEGENKTVLETTNPQEVNETETVESSPHSSEEVDVNDGSNPTPHKKDIHEHHEHLKKLHENKFGSAQHSASTASSSVSWFSKGSQKSKNKEDEDIDQHLGKSTFKEDLRKSRFPPEPEDSQEPNNLPDETKTKNKSIAEWLAADVGKDTENYMLFDEPNNQFESHRMSGMDAQEFPDLQLMAIASDSIIPRQEQLGAGKGDGSEHLKHSSVKSSVKLDSKESKKKKKPKKSKSKKKKKKKSKKNKTSDEESNSSSDDDDNAKKSKKRRNKKRRKQMMTYMMQMQQQQQMMMMMGQGQGGYGQQPGNGYYPQYPPQGQNYPQYPPPQPNQHMAQIGIIPMQSMAFDAPHVPLSSGKKQNSSEEEDSCEEDDDDGEGPVEPVNDEVEFFYEPQGNDRMTEVTFTVEPKKQPWLTMMKCGFRPVVNCTAPPCYLSPSNYPGMRVSHGGKTKIVNNAYGPQLLPTLNDIQTSIESQRQTSSHSHSYGSGSGSQQASSQMSSKVSKSSSSAPIKKAHPSHVDTLNSGSSSRDLARTTNSSMSSI